MNKNYEYVLQQNSYDCGIASLITVLMHYGIRPSREEILSKINKKVNGYSAYDLIKISKSYGIEASGIKSDIRKLQKFPVIAHTIKNENMYHFIVIFEINKVKNKIKIMDPEDGMKIISFEDFEKITTNIFLVFDGKKSKLPNDERFKKELISLFNQNKNFIIKTVFLSVLFVILSLIFNYYLKTILTYNTISEIVKIAVIFLFLGIIKNIINYVKNRLILKISIKMDKDITKKISAHILNLPYEYFVQKRSGELVTIVEDIENFKEIVIKIFILCLVDLVLILIVLLYVCVLNIYAGIILIMLFCLLVFITKRYQYILNDSFVKFKNNKIYYTSTLINYFTSFETIKNLNISPKISKILNTNHSESLKYEEKYNRSFYNYSFIQSVLLDVFYIIFIALISCLILNNYIEFLDVVLFSSLFYMLIGLLSNITESLLLYKVYQTSTVRILDCLNVPEEIFEKTNLSKISKIEFKNIKYIRDDNLILNNVSLEIFAGEKMYITGKSGIGKSTLIKLLLKYFSMDEGKILIDDINIDDLPLSFIRDNITYIGQNEELFEDSIINNLKLVCDDEDAINEASQITLLDKVMNKNGIDFNYLIKESGYNLSGGERKKMILTRGLLKMKNVLIMDEVFNEVSIEEERTILENIFSKYEDKIIIMISHRNSNQDLFDRKYDLKRTGDLVEFK